MNNKSLLLLGVCMPVAVMGLMFSSMNVAIPSIKQTLGISVGQAQWFVNVFGIFISSTVVTFGRLADAFGRKRLFMIGCLLLAIGMFGDGVATSATTLIAAQAIVGLAGGIILPVSQAILNHSASSGETSKLIGIWAAVIGLALAMGPIWSGVIIEVSTWHWIFITNGVIALLGLVLVYMVVSESKNTDQESTIDWFGCFFLSISVASFVIAVIQGPAWKSSTIAIFYALGTVSLILLLLTERKVKMPIIREELFKNRTFVTATSANACMMFYVWSVFFMLPLYLQTVRDLSPVQTGLIMLFVTIPLAVCSFNGKFLFEKLRPKRSIAIGFVFLMVSALLQTWLQIDSPIIFIVIIATAFGIGWGLMWGTSTTAAISTLPKTQTGIAAGTFTTFQEIGGTIGMAITVVVMRSDVPQMMHGYHNGMKVLIAISTLGLIFALLLKSNVQET